MATLILLTATVYLIWGVAKLIQIGFVREFNDAWVAAFRHEDVTPWTLGPLILLMLFMLFWCWLVWPLAAAFHRRDQAEPSRAWWV